MLQHQKPSENEIKSLLGQIEKIVRKVIAQKFMNYTNDDSLLSELHKLEKEYVAVK